jgi:polyphosphate kinase 2
MDVCLRQAIEFAVVDDTLQSRWIAFRPGVALIRQLPLENSPPRPLRSSAACTSLVHTGRQMSRKAKNKKKKKESDSCLGPEIGHLPKLKRKEYERHLEKLQVKLVALQRWVKRTGARIVVVFEGRDAAGKGGIIKRITERVSPRVFRVVALPAPNDREKTQLYLQRYLMHMPAAGEIIIFDRSWYNRAGVEKVLGFCTRQQHEKFLQTCDRFEAALVDDGIQLIKYWVAVSAEEQRRRFLARIEDPLRQWKLSPTDLESVRKWYEYSHARDAMMMSTDTEFAPWHVVLSDDKKRARLNCIRHLLGCIPYENLPVEQVEIPERETTGEYDDVASLARRRIIPEYF